MISCYLSSGFLTLVKEIHFQGSKSETSCCKISFVLTKNYCNVRWRGWRGIVESFCFCAFEPNFGWGWKRVLKRRLEPEICKSNSKSRWAGIHQTSTGHHDCLEEETSVELQPPRGLVAASTSIASLLLGTVMAEQFCCYHPTPRIPWLVHWSITFLPHLMHTIV